MKKYVEVDREPVVGDMVKIVKAESQIGLSYGNPEYVNGDILEITGTEEVLGRLVYRYGGETNSNGQYLYRSEFVVVEESTEFTKSDLKPCMVVRLRDDRLSIVSESSEGLCINSDKGAFFIFSDYDDEMTCSYGQAYDIVEIYGFRCSPYHANEISTDKRDLLYKRTELSARDIKIKELQSKMDALKLEMEELK